MSATNALTKLTVEMPVVGGDAIVPPIPNALRRGVRRLPAASLIPNLGPVLEAGQAVGTRNPPRLVTWASTLADYKDDDVRVEECDVECEASDADEAAAPPNGDEVAARRADFGGYAEARAAEFEPPPVPSRDDFEDAIARAAKWVRDNPIPAPRRSSWKD